jgi:hypothetical protein
MPAKNMPGRKALRSISGRKAAYGKKPSQVHLQRFSEETKSRSDDAFSGKHSEGSLLAQASQEARIIAASEGVALASTTSWCHSHHQAEASHCKQRQHSDFHFACHYQNFN